MAKKIKPDGDVLYLIDNMIHQKNRYFNLSSDGKNAIANAINRHGLATFMKVYNNSTAWCNDWSHILCKIDEIFKDYKESKNG